MPTSTPFGKNILFALGLFILYGWVEFEAFIWIGSEIGALLSFLGVFITAAIGVRLLRKQGSRVFKEAQQQIQTGQTPAGSLFDAAGLLLGAFLMLLPGYVTDVLGLICFLPVMRRLIGGFVFLRLISRMRRTKTHAGRGGEAAFTSAFFSSHASQTDDFEQSETQTRTPLSSDDVIEGDYEEKK